MIGCTDRGEKTRNLGAQSFNQQRGQGAMRGSMIQPRRQDWAVAIKR